MMFDYSISMSVYKNDKVTDFVKAVNSIWEQTVRPAEIILVEDGPLPELMHKAINGLQLKIPVLKVIKLQQNMGHAIARQTGLEACTNELVAIMDADDVSIPIRFEKQLRIFSENKDVSVVGGLINEFVDDESNIVGTRIVPEMDQDIKKYLKSRCPMNLVTVMFKKSDVQRAGGYIDWYCEEDYYLWIRMALIGMKFYNIQENLVNVRVGKEMYSRRGGWKYFLSEAKLQVYMFNKGIIGIFRLLYNIMLRFVLQVIMPNSVRGWLFQKFARN